MLVLGQQHSFQQNTLCEMQPHESYVQEVVEHDGLTITVWVYLFSVSG